MARLPRAGRRAGRRSASRSRPTGSGRDRRRRAPGRSARSQLRSVSTAIALVHGPGLAGSRAGGDVPLVRPQRAAGAAACAASVASAPFGHRRASSSSEMPSLGKLGVPVLPASQSMSRQRFASNTCSQAVRAVPARWLYDRPLRITVGGLAASRPCAARRRQAPCRGDGVRRVDPARGDAAHRVDQVRRRAPRAGRWPRPRASPSCRRCRARWRAHGPGPSLRRRRRRPRRRGTSPSRRRSGGGRRRRRRSGARCRRRAPSAASGASARRACRPSGSLISRP